MQTIWCYDVCVDFFHKLVFDNNIFKTILTIFIIFYLSTWMDMVL